MTDAPWRDVRPQRRFRFRSSTHLGTMSVRIVVGGVLLTWLGTMLIAAADFRTVPVALFGIVAMIVGGAIALFAIVRRGERSIAVFAMLPILASAVLLVIAEAVIPH